MSAGPVHAGEKAIAARPRSRRQYRHLCALATRKSRNTRTRATFFIASGIDEIAIERWRDRMRHHLHETAFGFVQIVRQDADPHSVFNRALQGGNVVDRHRGDTVLAVRAPLKSGALSSFRKLVGVAA